MKKVSEKFGYCENSQYLCGVKKAKDMKLTEKEKELIEAIRNFLKSKHNPSIELEFYARELFEKMMDGEEEEEEKEK